MKIGFIGLGIMGKPMVRNLLKAGHEVWVNNRSKAPMEELAKDGAHAASRQELAENSEIIITMLPNGPQVKEVMLGDVVNYMHAGQIFIDCSSISPVVSKEIAAVLAEKGVEMLDAPVSGGEPKAVDGTLSFMVGGKHGHYPMPEALPFMHPRVFFRIPQNIIPHMSLHHPSYFNAPKSGRGQTRNTILPTICSSEIHPTAVLRESTEVER